MNKNYLQSQLKTSGNAYLFWFFLGAHYAYLGRWGLQLLYWFTLGGVGIWAIIDLFTMNSKVEDHNQPILEQINKLEKDEKDTEHRRHMEVMAAMSGKANPQS
ncbi:MAG TPA: TM2 domain-containing protein [Flavobacteriales bacterium]|nr:TM2 domain-containing protein [Flavobacteriales bacterium]